MTAIGLILLLLAGSAEAAEVSLQYLGHSSFVLTGSRGRRLVIDPYASGEWPGLDYPYTHADVVVISHPHWDHDAWRQVRGDPEVVDELGDVREKGFHIRSLPGRHAETGGGPIDYENRILVIETDGLTFCHLGDNGPPDAQGRLAGQIGPVDVLMIPVDSEKRVLSYEQADAWMAALSPRVVIPMHYKVPGISLQSIEGIGTIDEWLARHPGFVVQPGDQVAWSVAPGPGGLPDRARPLILVLTLPGQAPPDPSAGEPQAAESRKLVQRGEEALAAGDEGTARQHLLEAARLDPSNPDPLMKLGFLYLASGRADRALELLERAVAAAGEGDPATASLSWLGRGMALDSLGRRPEAIEAYRKVVEIGINDQQQVDQARVYLERAYESM